jgi:omega-amidase
VRLTIALAQMAGTWKDPITTLREAEGYVRAAADAGAGLLCFPEQFATGWSPRAPGFSEELGGPITHEIGRLAAEYSIPILGSFVQATKGRLYNTCVVFDGTGKSLVSYAKMHLFSLEGEDRDYAPGESLATFVLDGVLFGIAICYDLRFAPLFHLYADRGVDCVVVPAAWPCRRIAQWELLVATRALESQCYVAGVNRTGMTPVERYCGHSLIATPSGTILARAGEDDDLICGEIDTARVQKARKTLPVLEEYRNDLYTRLAGEKE